VQKIQLFFGNSPSLEGAQVACVALPAELCPHALEQLQ